MVGKSVNEDIFDGVADRYSETIDESLGRFGVSHDFFTRHKARLIAQLLAGRKRDPARMDLLDVGCGIGQIHDLIGSGFRSVTGVDVSSASIEQAQARFPDFRYLAYDGERLPFPDAAFDMTMAICVFHHVPSAQWQALASEMLRTLRPGGLALVIEHNPWNPVTRRIVNTCPIDRDAVLLTRGTMVDLFQTSGEAEVMARSVLTIPPKTDLLMMIDGWFGRLPLGAQYWCLAFKHG